jgi:hypothetical protein
MTVRFRASTTAIVLPSCEFHGDPNKLLCKRLTCILQRVMQSTTESFIMCRNSLTAPEIAAYALLADVHPYDKASSKTCMFVRIVPDINAEPELKKIMKTKAAKVFTWPKHSLMGDEHKGITKLADHFQVEHNWCIYHKTSKFSTPWFHTLDLT